MKQKIKSILKRFYIFRYFKALKYKYSQYKRDFHNKSKKGLFKAIFFTKVINCTKDSGQIYHFLSSLKYQSIPKEGFIYYLNDYVYIYSNGLIYGNLSIDYSKVINCSLKNIFKNQQGKISRNFQNCLVSLEKNIDHCIDAIQKSGREDKDKYISYFTNIKNSKVNSFEEALQRILWYNQILWQTGHSLIGLGRLDKILHDIYYNDIQNQTLNKELAKKMIKNFLERLHENYWFKSNSLMGDTGQIIVLGGLEKEGNYFCNDLTYLFIECIKEMQLPDPKILLRVSNNMPDDLMQLSLETIKTGLGCPLFSNDEIVINKLIDFGIEKDDAYNYITSACWEPLIPGKSVAQNNICSIVFLVPFIQMLDTQKLNEFKNIEEVLSCYYEYLEKYIDSVIKEYEQISFSSDELLSVLTDECKAKNLSINEGGSKYNHVGFTTVSMSNLVESIINIDELVFQQKFFTLQELNEFRKENFINHEEVYQMLKNSYAKYGDNDLTVINITNNIFDKASEFIGKYQTKFGGKYKIGLSSPSYISDANYCLASLDGRKNFEPFNVHISSSRGNYVELIQFASKLHYNQNRINGNVVDFIVSPTILNDNMNKFKTFIKKSIQSGFYQMQMNVVSSEILIKAKENPDLFPNLIVRVWGFSAYFNDLPDEYKSLIIERTLASESSY